MERASTDRSAGEPEAYSFERLPSGRPRLVTAYFTDLDDARDAADALEERGYERERITVFMSTEQRRHYIETRPEFEPGETADGDTAVVESVELESGSRTLEGAGAGGAIGGGIGAVGAAIAAAGTTAVLPPLGIAVAGPVAAAFAGGGAGATAGGLIGALVGAGMSEYRAKRFKELLDAGNLIVGVEAATDPERSDLEEQLSSFGGTVVGGEEEPETTS